LKYKAQIVKAFEEDLKPVQALIPKQQRSSQSLKTFIKIAEITLPILIDIKASVCIISEDFAKKLKLKIKANNGMKVALLREKSKVKVIDLIFNTSIAVQNLHIPRPLYVMGEIELVVILGIDWMDWY